jgi:type IV pilus assembly protein PilB
MTNIRPTSDEEHTIVKLIDRILAKAIDDRTSHIYFEPQAQSLQIRVRRDGLLQIALQNLPQKLVPPTIAHLKACAKIDQDSAAPQTGTIAKSGKFGRVQIEITTLPTQFGESVSAKIAYIQQPPVPLKQLISNRENLEEIHKLIDSDRGLILIVGGQNSGKSSIVAASLAELQQVDRCVYAIERQVKYTIPGINQITLPADADDRTIERTIQTCLAQTPDVLAIGSIDRPNIAQAALQAVSQGCLVFATITAETAGRAIAHLIDLGIPPARLYTAIIGVVSQKMIQQVCMDCRQSEEPNSLELMQIGSTILSLNDRRSYYRASRLSLTEIDRAKQTGELCHNCQGVGYRGILGIQEVLVITDRLKSTIVHGDAEQIDLAAQELGMRSFMDLAISLFRDGKTTLSEVKRSIPPKTLLQTQLANAETYPDADSLELDDRASLEVAVYWQQLALKAKADYEQLLTELANDRQEAAQFEQRIKQARIQSEQGTRAEIALQLLSVIDVIELARTSIKPQTDREAAIQKGYSMLEHKMISSIRDIGVRFTESQGHKFDAHFHEVVQEIGTHEYPAGVVISEVKRGYTLGDRVLRLAQVKVAVASSFN